MILKFAKASDCEVLTSKVPESVIGLLKKNIGILDDSYGVNRNRYKEGGYLIYADDKYDIENVRENIVATVSEWIENIDGYTIALYLLGDDFAVVFCHPNN